VFFESRRELNEFDVNVVAIEGAVRPPKRSAKRIKGALRGCPTQMG
jgi:hypothetical protein